MGSSVAGREKYCKRCEKTLPISEFHKSAGKKDGRCEYCKYCKYEINKAYYSSAAGKLAVSGQTKRKWIRKKLEVSARNKVNIALAEKKIFKGVCSVCGTDQLIEAHHEDHAKPFEINWLCKRHHMEIHGKRLSKQENQYKNEHAI